MEFIDNMFDTFKETIFLKDDSNLIRQVEELKALRNTVENKNDIERDIKLLELGIKGENEIFFELKNANLGLYVLRDITIEYDGNKAQIDYVIISKGYTYLVECKNLIGNIYVDNNGQFKREYEYNNKKIKEAIYSPYTQAVRHKEILRKIWLSDSNKLKVALKEKYFDNLWYKPLVVLSNSKSLLNTRYAPKEIKNNIIRVDQLVNYIKTDIKNYDKNLLSNRKEMEISSNKWLAINISDYNSIGDKYKISKSNEYADGLLINKLKSFRLQRSKAMNIPAYYIFTDEEMEKIIKLQPKSIDELKEILSAIKIKCHGEEILKVISNS